MNSIDSLPLFPLADVVLLPDVSVPLRLFEPRYLQMARDALAGSAQIGMVTIRPDSLADIAGDPAGKLNTNQDDVITISVDGTKQIYVQHSKPRKKRDDDTHIQWTMVWTAPGGNRELIVGVAAVAANDDASALGDYVYTATARINSFRVDSTNDDRQKK